MFEAGQFPGLKENLDGEYYEMLQLHGRRRIEYNIYVLIQIRLLHNVGETYLSGAQSGVEIAITRWFQC
jgi:hypothetical protein